MKIVKELKKDVVTFRLTGSFDSANATRIYRELDQATHAGWRNIELLMDGVTSLGCAGLRVLRAIQSRLDKLNGSFVVRQIRISADPRLVPVLRTFSSNGLPGYRSCGHRQMHRNKDYSTNLFSRPEGFHGSPAEQSHRAQVPRSSLPDSPLIVDERS